MLRMPYSRAPEMFMTHQKHHQTQYQFGHRRAAAFTIVELLVVIGIIAILVSLTTISLSQAGASARQTQALNNLKQVGTAWMQYANQNDDRCMIGYADEGVQQAFRMRTRDAAGQTVAAADAATYPFRLLPFLNNDRSLMYDYIDEYEDTTNIPNDVIARNPAFGYNAYYLGGWWTTVGNSPKMRFSGTPGPAMVAKSIGQIEQTSEMIVFASSTPAEPGFVKTANEFAPGSAWVVPSRLATEVIWQSSDGATYQTIDAAATASDAWLAPAVASLFGASRTPSNTTLVQGGTGMEVLVAQSVPLRRIRNVVQTIRADLSTTTQGLRDLMNQRKWMNNAARSADPTTYTHPDG